MRARPRRSVQTLAAGAMLALSAAPFIGLAPEPPAFGRGAVAILAATAVLATMGTAWQAPPAQRAAIIRRAALLLAATLAAFVLRILLAGHVMAVPTLDVTAALFGLQGEDVDDAFLFEVWLEIWLACAAAIFVAARIRRAMRPPPAATAGPWDRMAPPHPLPPRWNAATVLTFMIGLAALAGAVMDGHWTAAFLSSADHVTGTIADPDSHPLVRFTTAAGVTVQFRQNGFVSRPLGAELPVAYQRPDPAGTARADTFWANWSDVLGMVWIGLGFVIAPFFGYRALVRPGRW